MSYSQVVWLPNALILTALLALVAWWRWRSAGALVGLRWAGVALLPIALYGVGVFGLAWRIGLAFSHFATGFVFRPSVWIGLALLLLAIALIWVTTRLLRSGKSAPSAPASRSAKSPRASARGSSGDDDMSDVQDILNRHGIG